MKKDIKYFITILTFCTFAVKSYSQLSFSIDTLKISDVFWLCEKDVWIEDFAYGPCFNMLFSIKNDGHDTVAIRYDVIKLYLEYGRKMSRKKKEPKRSISPKRMVQNIIFWSIRPQKKTLSGIFRKGHRKTMLQTEHLISTLCRSQLSIS